MTQSDSAERQKQEAANFAATLVEDGMHIGLGTGSTARLFVAALGRRVQNGLRVTGVATSDATAAQAASLGIPQVALDDVVRLDMVIDGADEVDPKLNLIKGLGGALLREKIVASSTSCLVIVVDQAKLVDRLGSRSPVPVEVVRFGLRHTEAALQALGANTTLRVRDGEPFVTDGGNMIFDCAFGQDYDIATLSVKIKTLTGVVEHGVFLNMATKIVVGGAQGVTTMSHA